MTNAQIAASLGHDKILAKLIQVEANLIGAVECAASNGQVECLRLLIEAGADLTWAARVAAWYEHVECFNLINQELERRKNSK